MNAKKRAIRLTVRRPIEVIEAVTAFFVDRGMITFEGDISQINWSEFPDAKRPFLNRNDEVTIPITAATREAICRSILPRIGLRQRVAHVVVSVGSDRVFASYDWFGEGMTVIESDDQEQLLAELERLGLVKEWESVEIGAG